MKRRSALGEALPELVRQAGILAWHCDHVEHNEAVDVAAVTRAAEALRTVAMTIFSEFGKDPLPAYAERIGRVEGRHPLATADLFDGRASVEAVRTWRDLQRAQALHDHYYHADVVGMPKTEQLRHYTLHVAKLAWLMQEASEREELVDQFAADRLPDILLFGIKLSTVMGETLADSPILIETAGRSRRSSRTTQ